ncbi:MAG: hypothetical protein OFPII_22370 [Osedax symbiont Rs1]|nr:MAG: hypothetical protein OFPII_22370 [Osedax symbiont Rs1]
MHCFIDIIVSVLQRDHATRVIDAGEIEYNSRWSFNNGRSY